MEVQRQDGLHFACKIVKIGNFAADVSEFKMLKKVQHKNVVTFLNVYLTRDKHEHLHAFYELCAASLADILTEELPVDQIKFVGHQILSGLRHIHQKQVIHRDIKPQNVLVDMNGNIKICDFGLSFDLENPPPMSAIDEDCGTPGYIPPEIFKGQNWSFGSDIWALSVVMLDMAMGIKRKRNWPIPFEIGQIYSKMSTENPLYRPSATQCLAQRFFQEAVFVNILEQ